MMTLVQNGRRTSSGKLWQGRLLFFLLATAGFANCSFGQFVYIVNGFAAMTTITTYSSVALLWEASGR